MDCLPDRLDVCDTLLMDDELKKLLRFTKKILILGELECILEPCHDEQYSFLQIVDRFIQSTSRNLICTQLEDDRLCARGFQAQHLLECVCLFITLSQRLEIPTVTNQPKYGCVIMRV